MSFAENHRARQIPVSVEELKKVVPNPELPIITAAFSADSQGNIHFDGGPGLTGMGRINSSIEDFLTRIAPIAAREIGFSREFGIGTITIAMRVDSAEEWEENTRKFSEIDRKVCCLAPQDEGEQKMLLEKSGVKKFAIALGPNDDGKYITRFLKKETKYQISSPGSNRMRRLIIEL
jgi:hypothetical protein